MGRDLDDREWAVAAVSRLVDQAREDAVADVRARLRERMVTALLHAVDEREGRAASGRATRPAAPAAAPGEAPPAAPASGTALWLYGVVDGDAPVPETTGVDGEHPVRAVRRGRVCALVSDVPLPQFGAEALQDGLEDLARVEALARAHEQVLEQALESRPVVPSRLCTIYASEQSLLRMVSDREERLAETLDRLRGAREWGVKAFLAAAASSGAATAADARSGTDYLARKREAREAAEHAEERLLETVERIHAGLSERASAAVVARPQHRELTGRDEEMVLNGSYLVPDDRLGDFRAAVGELAARHRESGIQLEMTGPWPPYHFVDTASAS